MTKPTTTNQVRAAFLDYFKGKGHSVVPSSPLVPGNDPTLLFTNAGMVQFKDVFTGQDKRPYKRATSSQKCVRAGGKHNDLENVGYTARHHTFFEMLGNFSFGDYFKKDAIAYAWEFITSPQWLGIDKSRLLVTVYQSDDEAYDIWHKQIGLPADRIIRIGDNKGAKYASDNFWAMGDTGPCGPCTEIFYDHGAHIPGGRPGDKNEDGDRWIEIWNVVFMQFERRIAAHKTFEQVSEDADSKGKAEAMVNIAGERGNAATLLEGISAEGYPIYTVTEYELRPLPQPSVDTGMGLERISALIQGTNDNYQIDTFRSLVRAVAALAKQQPYESASQKVVADHIRAASFLIADGVMPLNEGRGYVLRRIMRRAIRHGYKLGLTEQFFYKLVAPLALAMGDAYPQLREQQARIEQVIRAEEESFAVTLDKGMKYFDFFTRDVLARVVFAYARLNRARFVSFADNLASVETDDLIDHLAIYDLKALAAETQTNTCDDILKQLAEVGDSVAKSSAATGKNRQQTIVVSDLSKVSDLDGEMKKIRQWLPTGVRIVRVPRNEVDTIDGDIIFKLYDTYGFPVDLTADIARERGLLLDMAGYEVEYKKAQERSRAASTFKAFAFQTAFENTSAATCFVGHDQMAIKDAKVLALYHEGKSVAELREGEGGVVVLDTTPFYAQSGGQVGDRGVLTRRQPSSDRPQTSPGDPGFSSNWDALFEVSDTQKIKGGVFGHHGTQKAGILKVGDAVHAEVSASVRRATMRNHSATHLLHSALREVLGTHVAQKGSLVDAERTRFDFSHNKAVSADEIARIEDIVNRAVLDNVEVTAREMKYDEAIKAGAMALFGEKYGDEVRVLAMGEHSTELCGGTHVSRTGDIGLFAIISEGGVAAGIRRVEAVTGENALNYVRELRNERIELAGQFGIAQKDVYAKIIHLRDEFKKQDKEIAALKGKLASSAGGDLASQAKEIKGVKVLAAQVDGVEGNDLRALMDQLKNKLGSGIVLLGAASPGKVSLIAGVTADLTSKVKAGELVNFVAGQVGGKGGGRPDMAQAGGTEPDKLPAAIASVGAWIEAKL